jgi:Zn ribbon nucleic-acid-binding protein
MTWKLKGCPRCGGDIQLYEDMNNDWIETCLQCGYDATFKKFDWQMPDKLPGKNQGIRKPVRS